MREGTREGLGISTLGLMVASWRVLLEPGERGAKWREFLSSQEALLLWKDAANLQ